MKLKNLEEELEFIRSAEVNELYAYIKTTHFSHQKAEKALVKRGDSKLICYYIEKHCMQPSARIAVFQSGLSGPMQLLLAASKKNPNILMEFLTHGQYHTIKQYLKTCTDDISLVFPEQDMLLRNDATEIFVYMSAHKLTPFARYELIRRNNSEIVRAIIRKGKLNEREKTAIMEFSDWDNACYLINVEKNPEQVKMLRQMLYIRFWPNKKLERVIASHHFCKPAEKFFFKYGDFSLLVRYIKHYNIPDGQKIILGRAEPSQILNYLSKNQLCESGEKLLLDRGKHREIKAYIKSHYFTDENEVRFITRGRHNEIMLYLSRHSLCDIAQLALIYRRNPVEVEYFVSRYPLTYAAEKALLKCATPDNIRVWMQTEAYSLCEF